MTAIAEGFAPRGTLINDRDRSPKSRLKAFKDGLTASYTRFREPLETSVSPAVEQVVFSREAAATERREQSETRFWNSFAEKSKLLAAKDPSHAGITTGIVIGGGGMSGINSGVMLEEMEKAGLIDTVDVFATDSAATANVAFLLGGRTSERSGIYIDRLATRKFIRPGPHPGGMRLDHLMDFFRSDEGIDPEKIRNARSTFLIGTTDGYGNKVHWNARELDNEELFAAIKASCAAPYAYNRGEKIRGRLYTDGYLSGLSAQALADMGIKNIGVMINETFDEIKEMGKSPLHETLALRTAMWGAGYPIKVRDLTVSRRRVLQNSFLPVTNPDVDWALMAPPETIHWQSTDPVALEKLRDKTRIAFRGQLEKHGMLDLQTI